MIDERSGENRGKEPRSRHSHREPCKRRLTRSGRRNEADGFLAYERNEKETQTGDERHPVKRPKRVVGDGKKNACYGRRCEHEGADDNGEAGSHSVDVATESDRRKRGAQRHETHDDTDFKGRRSVGERVETRCKPQTCKGDVK